MKTVSCKNYPRCTGKILFKADVGFVEIKCRSCGLIDTYYVMTPKGIDKIKMLVEQGVIDLE
jgi:phage FluMu protein Com